MVTLKDVAQRAGVSLTTASRVLNKDTTMSASDSCRKAIFESAFELGYVPPRMKRRLDDEQTVKIGVADWHIVLHGYKNIRLSSLQYLTELMTLVTPLQFVQLGPNMLEEVDGVIAFGDFSEQEMEHLHQISHHIVFVNSLSDDFSHDRIVVKTTTAIGRAMEYIKSRSRCRHVAYIGGIYQTQNFSIGVRRTESILDAMKTEGFYQPENVLIYDLTQRNNYQDAIELITKGEIDALIVGSDIVARGVLDALAQRELTVVLYRDIDSIDLIDGEYASIRAYSDLVWQKAIQMLLEQIAGRSEAIQMIIPSRFVPPKAKKK